MNWFNVQELLHTIALEGTWRFHVVLFVIEILRRNVLGHRIRFLFWVVTFRSLDLQLRRYPWIQLDRLLLLLWGPATGAILVLSAGDAGTKISGSGDSRAILPPFQVILRIDNIIQILPTHSVVILVPAALSIRPKCAFLFIFIVFYGISVKVHPLDFNVLPRVLDNICVSFLC